MIPGGRGRGHDARESMVPTLGMQRGDQVYAAILADITAGRFAPGAKLVIEEIAAALHVSITPVRDALARLEGQGVVVRVPYQGSFVRAFEAREIQDLYEVRVGLEVLAVTLACSRIDRQRLERLREHQRQGEAALRDGDLTAYQAYNHAFHATIFTAADNDLLFRMMSTISLQMQMMIAQTIKVPGRPDRAIKEHLALVERLEEHDVDGAAALMKAHVYGALEDLEIERLP
jgi:DNA-binding GntR family transcriptional regulator